MQAHFRQARAALKDENGYDWQGLQPPGSPEGRAAGCVCPYRPYYGGLLWEVRSACPMHGAPAGGWPEFPTDQRYRLTKEEKRAAYASQAQNDIEREQEQAQETDEISFSSRRDRRRGERRK